MTTRTGKGKKSILKKNLVQGSGRYTDRFGNIITNISAGHLGIAFKGMDWDGITVYIKD